MADGNPSVLTATVDRIFEAVVIETLTSQGFRRSRRAVTHRAGDLYFSLRVRFRPNQPWGTSIFSLVGGVAVKYCLPYSPRATKPYDFSQLTVPWQSLNYGFEPDAVSKSAFILTTESELADAIASERDSFLSEIMERFRSAESVREHLWGAFAANSIHELGAVQSVYQWRYLAVLLASAGDASRLTEVQTRIPGLWSAKVPASVEQDWDMLWREAGLRQP